MLLLLLPWEELKVLGDLGRGETVIRLGCATFSILTATLEGWEISSPLLG